MCRSHLLYDASAVVCSGKNDGEEYTSPAGGLSRAAGGTLVIYFSDTFPPSTTFPRLPLSFKNADGRTNGA